MRGSGGDGGAYKYTVFDESVKRQGQWFSCVFTKRCRAAPNAIAHKRLIKDGGQAGTKKPSSDILISDGPGYQLLPGLYPNLTPSLCPAPLNFYL